MKPTKLDINNFQIIADMEVNLASHPLHLFAAENRQGKSSVAEAVRYALLGKPTRVEDKKTLLKMLVRDGAKAGAIRLEAGDSANSVELPKGVITDEIGSRDNVFLPYVLTPELFASVDAGKRRTFLFQLTELEAADDVLRRKLEKRKCDPEKIDHAIALARAGFDSAYEEVRKLVAANRAGWKAITGEAYGSNKAEEWQAAKPEVSEEHVSALLAAMNATDETRMKLHADMAVLREKCATKPAGYTPTHHSCPACQADLAIVHNAIAFHPGDAPEAVEPDPQDVLALNQAQEKYDEAVREHSQARNDWMEANRDLEQAKAADDITAKAKAEHVELQAWELFEEAFAPDGIPAELLADALKPMNLRLRAASLATGWEQVQIMPDMSIQVGGRLYQLESESSKWRADAMIAESISFLSGLRFLLLDRIDVLQPNARIELVKWLDGVADDGEINTALAFGTFAQKPAGLPGTWGVHWIENGEIVE